jgi:predicted 3-demethylubiquinone-9 3-methyltransferase (glyoxalase superfamily)
MPQITPFLWFDTEAEDAAGLYTSVFPNSRVVEVARYGSAGPGPEGAVMTVVFELDGQRVVGLNGGPVFAGFTETFSFAVECETQEEVDRYWDALTADGGEEGQCGWLKDRFGLSWQIVPRRLHELLADPDRERAARVTQCMLGMRRLVLAELEAA